MLVEFFKIIMSVLAVYGGYCILVNITYTIFCRKKTKIVLAYMASEEKNNFSEIFLAKKLFMGRSRVIILLDYNSDNCQVDEIKKSVPNIDIYRTERIK